MAKSNVHTYAQDQVQFETQTQTQQQQQTQDGPQQQRQQQQQHPSYFTCTLSEALEYNRSVKGVQLESTDDGVIATNNHYQDVNSFVDFLADNYANNLAVGCCYGAGNNSVLPTPASTTAFATTSTTRKSERHRLVGAEKDGKQKKIELLNFEDVRRLSKIVGHYLQAEILGLAGGGGGDPGWVALIASSSTVFLLVWLGLLRTGFKVLLIAPQSPAQTVHHLLSLCHATAICHDGRHKSLVEAIETMSESNHTGRNDTHGNIRSFEIPWKTLADISDIASSKNWADARHAATLPAKPSDIAYSFHSSGTTGLPKLIPQTQHGAVGVLPLFQELHSSETALPGTFTTTPLYSGGVADLFRSWCQAAPLWLFPEARLPITAQNLLSCIQAIDDVCHSSKSFTSTQLRYLSCVPFVLEPITEVPILLHRLSQMDKVGVGGAAMPKALGDKLVSHNVPLVSRFGSSENGFLLSSDRDFAQDKNWDILRSHKGIQLEFNKLDQKDECFELIVPATWPLVCIASHAKRPFNTHDLFAQCSDRPYQWYYRGRSDAQLTLKTGKKFDPSDMEALLRSDSLVEDAIVIGDGQIAPGVLIFVAQHDGNSGSTEREQLIRQVVEQANSTMPKHARVAKQYIRLLPQIETSRIRKTNKGSVVRSSVEAVFASEISQLYDIEHQDHVLSQVDASSERSITSAVRDIVQEQFNSDVDLNVDQDLFDAGLDSQGCMAICAKVQRTMGIKVTLSVVYECGTIEALASHIQTLLGVDVDAAASKGDSIEPKLQEMRRMVDECIKTQLFREMNLAREHDFEQQQAPIITENADKTVLLTGSTGFLGIHVLNLLLIDTAVARICLLIRGSRSSSDQEQQETAKARVRAALSFHQLDDNPKLRAFDSKCLLIPFFVQEDDLGIEKQRREELINSVTHVIHAAWEVNFNFPLKAFQKHVMGSAGLYSIAELASRKRRKDVSFCFCSSVASIQNAPPGVINDLKSNISVNPDHSARLGYGQSKWVTEQVLHKLNDRKTGVKLSLLRVGQLSGDTINGIWSRREAWPLMIDASINTIPCANHEANSGVSTERQKSIFPDLAQTVSPPLDWLPVDLAAKAVVSICTADNREEKCLVQSICNNRPSITWPNMQVYFSNWAFLEGLSFNLLAAHEWLNRLERSQGRHQAKALIPLWRKNWVQMTTDQGHQGNVADEIHEDGTSVPALGFKIDEPYIKKILTWVARSTQ